MRMSFRQRAPHGTTWGQDAFASQVGAEVDVKVLEEVHRGRLLAAAVSDDGKSAELTIDVPEDLGLTQQAPGSFGFTHGE